MEKSIKKCRRMMKMVVILDINKIINYKERDDLLHRIQKIEDSLVKPKQNNDN